MKTHDEMEAKGRLCGGLLEIPAGVPVCRNRGNGRCKGPEVERVGCALCCRDRKKTLCEGFTELRQWGFEFSKTLEDTGRPDVLGI